MNPRGTKVLGKQWPSTALWLVVCLASSSIVRAGDERRAIVLRDVTRETGIDFRHTDGGSGRHYIVEYVASGIALFDYNGDGRIDVYFLNGAPLPGTNSDTVPRNALYRNEGDWKFTDVTTEAGVGDTGHGLGVAVGDYDNDGHPDLYLNNFGPNVLYRNNGDGTFTDVTQRAGVANGDRVGAGVSFLDVDADGDLDLYVSNYIEFSYDRQVDHTDKGVDVYPGPDAYTPDPDTLYRNNGDGTFTDVSAESGVSAFAGNSMGMVCADYDNDGDTDVVVGNDEMENFLYENDGSGRFAEIGLLAGLAFDANGIPQGTMAVECGDYNNDGYLDFFMTSYARQLPALYRNSGNGFFEDITVLAGAGTAAVPMVTWGTGLVDFDNDGDRDLFIACGHIQDTIEAIQDTTSYEMANILLENREEKYVDVSRESGDGMAVKLVSRGAGFDDLDNDGDLDAVILNARREATILRNDTDNGNHWLEVSLRGVRSNRDGVGAHVKVVAGDLTQIAEVHSGRSYQSHYGTRLHFGLGRRDRIDRIDVTWIGGTAQRVKHVRADQIITITEDPGTTP
ncbi:MAG TPA: CRTAC1 family protein [Thermoguttaceae bacterium]|nr:CRTAC1 family protein [Thermoguttaceae bacterium]